MILKFVLPPLPVSVGIEPVYGMVSVPCRTGLRRTETEIENPRPESDAAKPPIEGQDLGNCQAETRVFEPRPQECRRFSRSRISHRGDRTVWLTRPA